MFMLLRVWADHSNNPRVVATGLLFQLPTPISRPKTRYVISTYRLQGFLTLAKTSSMFVRVVLFYRFITHQLLKSTGLFKRPLCSTLPRVRAFCLFETMTQSLASSSLNQEVGLRTNGLQARLMLFGVRKKPRVEVAQQGNGVLLH
jgi:hypothetical protein